ncbi:DUF2267 domain-containing protein [Mesobacterium pallidum]|uniref:DUF2267 domain-containing protein n=1 Tax=Mesobacterium pallidum TaxID=2872037 RepID=UPI001EE19882|nr:DUF2267 domain-containing protein [Mesobacterium pallidum]
MPMPWTFRHAQKEWRGILDDMREVLNTPSDNVAYTGLEGVFRAFRDRLPVAQAIAFAQVLPALPRALFVQRWDPAPPRPWADPSTYVAEARAFRGDHNFAGPEVLRAAFYALHRAIQPVDLHRALDRIGPEARAFWQLDGIDPGELGPRFR